MRELSELDDCIKKGLIRKMPASKDSAQKSISKAKMWLQDAEGALHAEIYDLCLLAAYESMFHAARALLIKDGYRERSHYCVARYVDEIYVKKKLLGHGIINTIDNYRELRHDAAYSLEFEFYEDDAVSAIRDAKTVLKAIEKLIG